MARIIVFQHGPKQGPGRLGATLRDHGFRLDIRRVDLPLDQGGGSVPVDLDNVQGVISLGALQNIGDKHPFIEQEAAFLKKAHDAGIPVIGVCFGAELLAHALGGKVSKMSSPEVGFVPVKTLVPGQTDIMLAGVPWETPFFQMHGSEISELPEGATLLASSDRCKVQAFSVGMRTFGFQHHFEADREMIERMASEGSALFAEAGIDAEELSRQAERHYAMFARVADRLCLNLATYAFPFDRLMAV